jgi:hypothetical protein
MNCNLRTMVVGAMDVRVAILMAVLLVSAPAAAQQQRSVLENGGVGKVRIGMSVKEAERVIGAGLRSLVSAYGPGCWLAVRADGIDPGLSYMVENGRITRIDVGTPREGAAPRITTAKGIGIGSTQADVELNYGSSAVSALAPYGHDDSDRWITVEATPALGIVISVSGGKVVGLWAGRRQSIAYAEACS